MDEIANHFTLTSTEQVEVLAKPYFLTILRLLITEPRTIAQLTQLTGEVRGKALYHVRVLQRLGLVREVNRPAPGEKGERYFRAVAREFTPDPQLLPPS